jgi:tRNA nucleotidyltransferase (CCA-adding enzyme)
LRKRLAAARRVASKRRSPLYLVGGAVRDLLLGKPVADIDLAIEGDGVVFARALARELGARPRPHERFGTVTLEFRDGSRLDIASTRAETYEARGALPSVAAAPLGRDLARRDFTINAIALRLAPRRRPVLIDPFGGVRDIGSGTIRMMHENSPQDDPTRAFRAVRYANRLRFRIDPRTRRWIRQAAHHGAFDGVSGDRMRRELRLLFSEPDRATAVRLMGALGIDRMVDPDLRHDEPVLASLRRAEAIARRHPGQTTWLLFLLVWSGELGPSARERLSRRLSLAGEADRRLRSFSALLGDPREDPSRVMPSTLLERVIYADEIAAAAALLGGTAGRRLERALRVSSTRLQIRGRDLIAAGIAAGPRIGHALKVTLAARRDGRISKSGELAFAIREARRTAS